MMNQVTLVGRLTKDPELRYTPNGVAVATFTIAVNRPFANQQGERESDFINCQAWRKQAENLCNFQQKGNLIGVVGSIQTRNYEGQDGKRIYVTEVLADRIAFLEKVSKPSSEQETGFRNENQKPSDDPFANQGETIDISDDDLPF